MDTQLGSPEAPSGAEVRLEALSKTYGDFVAVRDLSLVAASGEFFTILGPSGSGKTTTLMMIAGFTQPSSGVVSIDGRDVTRKPPQARDIGMVFQNYALFPHLTVFDNLAFPLRVRRVQKPKIEEQVRRMLELVRLEELAARLPQQLSGGQQQRVALARALIFQPRLVLLDEPLGALDKKLRSQMQSEIKQLQQRLNLTVVYITHDQEEALTMSDKVAVMNRGRIEQLGTPRELYERPANRFVADFLGEANFLSARVVRIVGREAVVITAGGLQFRGHTSVALSEGQEVVAAMRPERLRLAPAKEDNGSKGRVVEVIYVGDATRYRVEIEPGLHLVAKVQSGTASAGVGLGQQVELAWSAADTHIYTANSAP